MTIVILIVWILTNIPRAIQLTDRGVNNTEGSRSANASTETIPQIIKQQQQQQQQQQILLKIGK